MKYKHIIWDYNGTILDDVDIALSVLNTMLKGRNLPIYNIDEYREIFDFPIIDYYKVAGFDMDKYPFSQLADEFVNEYDMLLDRCKLRDGAEDILEFFTNARYSQSILTAGRQENVIREISDFGISKYFDAITGLHNNLAASKVHLASEHIKKINIPIEKILFIGDTTHDFLVAKKIGCDCVLVADGHQSTAKLGTVSKNIALRLSNIKDFI